VSRAVCNFSCDAASAVATKFAVAEFLGYQDVAIVNACVYSGGTSRQSVISSRLRKVVRLSDYGSARCEIWRIHFRGVQAIFEGASLGALLQALETNCFRRLLTPRRHGNIGYTKKRGFDNFLDASADIKVRARLIENKLGKADCLVLVERAGIQLPAMYLLGFNNAKLYRMRQGRRRLLE
jgi:hypothetical protein